jgi:hypothetical protein
MSMRLKWRGDEFGQRLHNATSDGLKRATVYYHTQARQAVSKPNSGVRVPVMRRTPGGNKKSRTIYPNPSKPGEPPKLRTGQGQRGVIMEFDESEPAGRVGISRNAKHMLYLELGTRRVRRRPWLVETLRKHLAAIGKLAATGGKGKIGT